MIVQPEPPTHAKVCSNCREFMVLFPNHEPNERLESKFDAKHRNHMVSIMGIRELNIDNYKRFEPKNI